MKKDKTIIKKLTKKAINETWDKWVNQAVCNISNHAVGACLIASNDSGEYKIFGGCNIELATSRVDHAEHVALMKAISEGYLNFHVIVVSSKHKDQRAALCGYCRQDFMYANPEIEIIVTNPDKSIKIKSKLIKLQKYPYMGKGKLRK